MRVGWVGLGVMGRSMAGHLLAAGHDLRVFTRTRATADELLAAGATWADSPAAVAEGADLVGIMVGTPADVREVTLGDHGVLSSAGPAGSEPGLSDGSLLIDFTTSEPALAREIAAVAASAGVGSLDAPVSGGDVGARNATLSIMVGGDLATFERARPALELLGTTIERQGPAGSGQHTKMVNQILVAGTMVGLGEALAYAEAAGLDLETVLRSVGGGAAASWALTNLAPRVLAGDLAPGFAVRHFVKDLGIALDVAAREHLDLPGLALAHDLYASLARHGGAELGTHAIGQEIARRSRPTNSGENPTETAENGPEVGGGGGR